MKTTFQIKPAKLNAEATICEYMSLMEGSMPCVLDPKKCELGRVGKIVDGTFTPSNPKIWRCPKLEMRQLQKTS